MFYDERIEAEHGRIAKGAIMVVFLFPWCLRGSIL